MGEDLPVASVVDDDGDDDDEDDDDDGGEDEDEDAGGAIDRHPAEEDGVRSSPTAGPSSRGCPLMMAYSYSATFPRYRVDHPRSSSHGRGETYARRARRLRRGTITKLAVGRRPGDVASDGGGGGGGGGKGEKYNRAADGRPFAREDGGNQLGMLLGGILGVFDPTPGETNAAAGWSKRKYVEFLYREEMKMGNFRWVSSSSSYHPPPSGGASNGEDDAGGGVLPQSGRDADEDVHAAAEFWRMAADIVTGLATAIDDPPVVREGSTTATTRRRIWYLALPETTPSVARNLCDNLNWYAEYYSSGKLAANNGGGGGEAAADLILRSDLDTARFGVDAAKKIPVVMFTATIDDAARRRLAGRRDERGHLPGARDTERRTKAWVTRLLVQLGICPFTKSEVRSGQGLRDLGVPVASIMYRHSEALDDGSDVYLLMAGKWCTVSNNFRRCDCVFLSSSWNDSLRIRSLFAYNEYRHTSAIRRKRKDAWKAISDMVTAGPTGVSSILLSAPGFDDRFDLWAGPVFAMLESCVGAIQAEEIVGVVCFHPKCEFVAAV